MKDWILASRPKTLTAALVPILATSAMVFNQVPNENFVFSLYALMAAIFIQIGTNFVNDAMDFKKGADTEKRIGPQRITASGKASPRKVLIMAGFCFLISVAFGIPLVLKGGLPVIVIGLFSIFFGYAYTSGPYPLAYKGLGDVFVILFFGLVAVLGMQFILTDTIGANGIILGLQMGSLSTVLIAINNFRDIHGDRLANKMTLAARFGETFARREIQALILFAFLLNVYWVLNDFFLPGLLPSLALPLALNIIRYFNSAKPSSEFNLYLGKSAGLHLVFGLLLALGFLL